MRILRDVREFIQWRKSQKHLRGKIQRLLSIEMGDYSYDQCLLAAGHNNNIPHEHVGTVAIMMHARCSRGKTTLEEAMSIYSS